MANLNGTSIYTHEHNGNAGLYSNGYINDTRNAVGTVKWINGNSGAFRNMVYYLFRREYSTLY